METLQIIIARFIVGPVIGIVAGLIVAGMFIYNSPELLHISPCVSLIYFLVFAIGGVAVMWDFGL